MAESEEELKSLLIKVKEEGEKAGFIFLGSKFTADGDCSHEIKRRLAPWKKSYDWPRQCIKKQGYHYWQRSI